MITHLDPDILECKVKRALGSISTKKASGGDGIPVELFQILNDDAVKVLYSANLENSAVATELEMVSFHFNPKERKCQRMLKLQHDCTHLTYYQRNAQNSPSQASTVCELCTSTCSDGFRKGRGNRCQIANSCWTIDKGREFQEIIYFCFIDYTKAFDWVDHNKLWKIL